VRDRAARLHNCSCWTLRYRELQYRQCDKLTQTHQREIDVNKRLGSRLSFIRQLMTTALPLRACKQIYE
jgi:hypothetical protein